MIVTLHFNLPEDKEEYEGCINGSVYREALRRVDEGLRRVAKYGREGFDKETVLKMRELFYEEIDGVDI